MSKRRTLEAKEVKVPLEELVISINSHILENIFYRYLKGKLEKRDSN